MGTFYVYNKAYVGKYYWTEKRTRVSGVFSYDDQYLAENSRWNIDPTLALVSGAQPIKSGLPGAFQDASPDRWGKTLIRHRHIRESKNSGITPKTLNDVDYLMGVSDSSRHGDLRFSMEINGEFQHPSEDIPKLISLPKLLYASNQYIEKQDEDAISYLLDAGSASLGGARPKTAVLDGEDLYIAKFPHRHDKWNVMAWEWVCLQIAAEAGISTPENKLIKVDEQSVFMAKRFDRIKQERVGYISMMTLLGLTDNESADYFEIAERLHDVSVSAKKDLEELFRRIVLSLLVNNTDDHLRNHGLLRNGSGWRLSPAFDINPNPDKATTRVTSIFGEPEKEPAFVALRANASSFDLTLEEANKIISEVSTATKSLEKYAKNAGIDNAERKAMLQAIETTIA